MKFGGRFIVEEVKPYEGRDVVCLVADSPCEISNPYASARLIVEITNRELHPSVKALRPGDTFFVTMSDQQPA